MIHLLHPLDGLAAAMESGQSTMGIGAVKVCSTKRACPVCGTSYPELDPRMFSHNCKHGWCSTCVGTGLALTREQRRAYDDSVREDDAKGGELSFPAEEPEVEGVIDQPCPDCHGTRLNPASRGVSFDGRAISEVAAHRNFKRPRKARRPGRPTRTGYLRQQDRGSGAHSDRLAIAPEAPLALVCGLDLRVDPHLVNPRPLCAQRRPAALRRCSLRMWR